MFEADLSAERLEHYEKQGVIALDTETRGLVIRRDRLCLVQIADAQGVVSLVRYQGQAAERLKGLLENPRVLKVIHFARFDLAVLKHYLNAQVSPFWCTKIASKLVRTYTDRHSLKELGRELLGREMDKSDQSSDWAREDLSDSQLEYAANDVRVLLPIYEQIKAMVVREGKLELCQRLFDFLPTQVELDLGGWKDIFEH